MVVRALHHVAVNLVRLKTAVQRRMHRRAALERIQAVLCRVGVCESAGLEVGHVAASAVRGVAHASHALIAERHVDQRLLVVMVAAAASAAAVRVVVLPLQLVLDPLAIRRVPDKRQNRADALDEERALGRFRVIQCSLQATLNEHPEDL